MGKKIGYARVSLNQNETRQIENLKKAGVEEIYIEKSLGKNFIGRDSWNKLLIDCTEGDTIVITELNRLGRNKLEIKENFELIQKKGINLEVLNMPLFNAGISAPLISNLICPIVLELLDYMANEEKKTILKRQKEAYESLPRDEKGRIVSKKNNKPVGRENAFDNMTTKQRKTIDLWIEKRITTDECIKITKFSRSTIFRIKKILKSEKS
nr:recombinase family protein [uncultured Fusobacterium sp.]